MTSATTTDHRRRVETPRGAAIFMITAVALLWALEAIDTVLLHALDAFGIHAHELDGLVGILFAPFLHLGFAHLAANSVPMLVLGFLILLGRGGLGRFVGSTVVSALTSGIAAWVLTPAHTVVLGASGVIFGWLTYLVARGFFARDVRAILVGLVVFAVYGSVLWGVFPTAAGVSWQAHAGGAVGGVLAGWLMHRRAAARVR